MRVSVVVPAYNEEVLLPACLAALRVQDFAGDVEIIVVDNASTDRTAEAARSHGVIVLEEPERGYCRALIRGFEAATGEVIACTDADTVVPPDWISRLVREYARRPEAVAIGGHVEFTRRNWKCRLLTRLVLPVFNRIDRSNPDGPHLWGANFSVRRDAFREVGGWNPRFSLQADSELSVRLRKVGRVVLLDSLTVHTSSRRWNQSLLLNGFIYASNWFWFKFFSVPLYTDFPTVRCAQAEDRLEA